MSIKKLLLVSVIVSLSITSGVNAAYEEVSCTTDSVFAANSCDQCFTWGEKWRGANIGLLSDKWINNSNNSQLLFKDEQKNPEMIPLNGSIWNQLPDTEGFWEYTEAMKAKYDEIEWGYVLWSKESVDWIQSALGSAYNLAENTAAKWVNIGLLVYPIATHMMAADDTIEADSDIYKECVLFTSAAPTKPKLPKTWPESILLLIIAMLLGFGLLKITKRA